MENEGQQEAERLVGDMDERHHGRSRRREGGSKTRRPAGCLVLLILLVVAGIGAAAAVLFLRGGVGQREREYPRDTSAAVQPELFPGDTTSRKESGERDGETAGTGPEEPEDRPGTAEEFLRQMTLEEKVFQLFMVTPEALTGVDEVYAAGEKTKESIVSRPVGGIVYFRQNLRSPEQTTDMLTRTSKYFRDRIGLEPFLGVDEEGGQVARISGREEFGIAAFPDMSAIGAEGDPGKAYEVGDQIGAYLAELGFNLDFAPVADVLTNPENTVVARRSFGSDGAVTAVFSNEMLKGLKAHGIHGVLKHFPGHGGTQADSHEGYAETERTLEELMAEDFVPFKEGIEAGAEFIMAGHIAAPGVTGDDTPAAFSHQLITDVLRGQLGFDGIVITDALNMGAVTAAYSPAEAAVQALAAGNDMLLMPEDFEAAYQGVLAAVADGRLTEERIDESVERILRVKLGQ